MDPRELLLFCREHPKEAVFRLGLIALAVVFSGWIAAHANPTISDGDKLPSANDLRRCSDPATLVLNPTQDAVLIGIGSDADGVCKW